MSFSICKEVFNKTYPFLVKRFHSFTNDIYCRESNKMRVSRLNVLSYSRKFILQKNYLNRYFSRASSLRDKIHVEGENTYAHGVMERLPAYSNNLASPISDIKQVTEHLFHDVLLKDWNQSKPDEIYDAFETLSHYVSSRPQPITDPTFNQFCEVLASKTNEMSDDSLIGMLALLPLWPQVHSITDSNFYMLWNNLDQECVKRIKMWDKNKALLVSDYWYRTFLARRTFYIKVCNLKLGRKPNKLLPYQLIHCLFNINVNRKWHLEVSKFDFEFSIEQCLDKLSLDEIAIFAMAFFKGETKIHSSVLLSNMVQRTISEIDSVHEIALCAILKVLRYSINHSHHSMLTELQEKLVSQIPRLSLACCAHAATLGNGVLCFHEELIKAISERFCKEIKSARLKDIVNLSLTLGLFGYNPQTQPCILRTVIEELQRPDRTPEREQYKRCLPSCLYYISLIDEVDLSIIDNVMEANYLQNVYGKPFNYGIEVLGLDVLLEVEHKNYSGNRLNPKIRDRLVKKFRRYIPSHEYPNRTATDTFMLEVMDKCEEILGGQQNFCVTNVIPSFELPDIVFGLGKDMKPVMIPEDYKSLPLGSVKLPPSINQSVKWYAVVIGGWKMYMKNNNLPIRTLCVKLRQLQILGYTPIVIPWFEWNEQLNSRSHYLLKKISMLQ